MLTVRDVSMILGISEKEVIDLAESGAIPAYKVGGVFLRFKKEQVFDYKKSIASSAPGKARGQGYSLRDRVNDFLYFNDFYILAVLLIVWLAVIILKGF